MSNSLSVPALTRLLSLNNRVHDLENQLLQVELPVEVVGGQVYTGTPGTSSIAQMQEEIDQGVRASLMTCWLGMDAVQED
ncbi:MAG: hypothetical protein IIB30_01710 [Chloroflexi bacterium]|nr:hypothetical protein [Chloroflexota bacterium]MCH8224326.1 hypothetical protein [Chloroflexota bacterium]MCI0845650.1 hypothetical protein [Chloroflexota bacterium]